MNAKTDFDYFVDKHETNYQSICQKDTPTMEMFISECFLDIIVFKL